MARPRLPLRTHKLRGTKPHYDPADTPAAPATAAATAGRPRYPKGLSRSARSIFKELCALLEERRSLTRADGEALRLYAILYDRQARAMAEAEREGFVVTQTVCDSHGAPSSRQKKSLYLTIAQESERAMLGILDRLGFTPSARTKVQPTQPAEPTKRVVKPGSIEAEHPDWFTETGELTEAFYRDRNNSIPGAEFDLCLAAGFDVREMDAMDIYLLGGAILHDSELRLTSDARAAIREMSDQQRSALRARVSPQSKND